jgi:hypothetical protein
VTSIGYEAFQESQLKSVIFSENSKLESIGSQAFYDVPITSIIIPDSVTTIGGKAFFLTQLTNIIFSENSKLESIGSGAFEYTPLLSITIPNTVRTIENYAFKDSLITSIIIPDSVTTIGAHAFANTPITGVTIPDSVTLVEYYGYGTFSNCPFQTIKINCNKQLPSNANNIMTILGDMSNKMECQISNINTLQIAISSSLVENNAIDLEAYIAGILALENTVSNTIIKAISKKSGLFELDLSNTDLTQADIVGLKKTLPWTVIADGERIEYGIQE